MRHMLTTLAIIIAAIAVGIVLYVYGPSELQQAPAPASPVASMPDNASLAVPFAVIAEGTNAADMPARKTYVVYDQGEFARLWALAMGDTAVPSIDFSSRYVIMAFAGEKPTGGYSVWMDSITDENGVRTVSVALTRPSDGCMVTQAVTSPFQIVSAPFTDWEHVRRDREVRACE